MKIRKDKKERKSLESSQFSIIKVVTFKFEIRTALGLSQKSCFRKLKPFSIDHFLRLKIYPKALT